MWSKDDLHLTEETRLYLEFPKEKELEDFFSDESDEKILTEETAQQVLDVIKRSYRIVKSYSEAH